MKQYWSKYPGKYMAGDSAKRDSDGYFWVIGRTDDVIKVAGYRLGTAEIESALVSHPAVAEAAVIGLPHEVKGQAIHCYCLLRQGFKASPELEDEVKDHVAQHLGPDRPPGEGELRRRAAEDPLREDHAPRAQGARAGPARRATSRPSRSDVNSGGRGTGRWGILARRCRLRPRSGRRPARSSSRSRRWSWALVLAVLVARAGRCSSPSCSRRSRRTSSTRSSRGSRARGSAGAPSRAGARSLRRLRRARRASRTSVGVSIVPQIYREAVRGLVELRDFLASVTPEKIDGWARDIDALPRLRYGIPVDVAARRRAAPRGRGSRSTSPPGSPRRCATRARGCAAAARRRGRVLARAPRRDVPDGSSSVILLFMLTAFISMDAPRIVRFFESLVPAAPGATTSGGSCTASTRGSPASCAGSSRSCW